MFGQIIIENGQKKIKPITADVGAGLPVGAIVSMYKKSAPSGFLYCDGSTFSASAYPVLASYLGTNVLPDYREFGLVGAEENTTDVYDATTNPNGTIHDHDIYAEGQAKDDQFQGHLHTFDAGLNANQWGAWLQCGSRGSSYENNSVRSQVKKYTTDGTNGTPRVGTTTRGKRKAVYFYIKATSGLSENQQDSVINALNVSRSYSTEETLTGKTWIDGKPIYKRVFTGLNFGGGTTGTWNNTGVVVADVDTVVKGVGMRLTTGVKCVEGFFSYGVGNNSNIQYYGNHTLSNLDTLVLEYTKTTD